MWCNIIGLNIWYVSVAYPGFLNVYGDKSFSKGVFGFLLCAGPNVFVIVILSFCLYFMIRKINKKYNK